MSTLYYTVLQFHSIRHNSVVTWKWQKLQNNLTSCERLSMGEWIKWNFMNSKCSGLRKNVTKGTFCQLSPSPSPTHHEVISQILGRKLKVSRTGVLRRLSKELYLEVWVGLKESTENGGTGTQGVMRVRSCSYHWAGSDVGQGLVFPELGKS